MLRLEFVVTTESKVGYQIWIKGFPEKGVATVLDELENDVVYIQWDIGRVKQYCRWDIFSNVNNGWELEPPWSL